MESKPELSPGTRVMCLAVNNGAGARILLNVAQGNRGDGRFCEKCLANQSCRKLHAEMKK